jgi:hypothetical protein
MEPIHCNTLEDFPPDKYMLLVYCSDCQRRPELNRSALPADSRIQAGPASAAGMLRLPIRINAAGYRMAWRREKV